VKKNNLYHSIFSLTVLFLIILINSCNNQSGQKINKIFKDIKPAKGNNFLKFDSIAPGQMAKPAVAGRTVNVFDGTKKITGSFTTAGKFSVIDSTKIRFVNQNNDTVYVYAGLPKTIALKNFINEPGILNSVSNSSVQGANDFFELKMNQIVFLGYLWQVSSNPISYMAPVGKIIEQDAVNFIQNKDSIINSPVYANTDSGKVKIIPGNILKFKKGGVGYEVFVQTSIYRSYADEGADGTSGYILHTIVIYD